MAADPIVLAPGAGRDYAMGVIGAVFKADGAETGGRLSISEWRLEGRHRGPGAHEHETEDEIFFVLEGTASILVGDRWHRLDPGGFCYIPAGTIHDFRNEAERPTRLLNIFLGSFEDKMPSIAEWFVANPPPRL